MPCEPGYTPTTIHAINLNAVNFVTLHVEMTNCKCTFIVDSGADVSLFKVTKVPPMQIVDLNKKLRITGVTDGVTETIAEARTYITFDNNLKLDHSFQLVSENFPIPTDGILGRDFLVKFRCTIDYDNWLLNFNFHPIILSPRCEVIRKLPNFFVNENSIFHALGFESRILSNAY